MSRRPGFVSVAGIVVAVLLLAGVAAWTWIAGPVLFSPGQLSTLAKGRTLGGVASHAELAGNCGGCHAAPWSSQTMVDRCVTCHTGVGAQIESRTGLHGRLLGSLTSPTCRGCHTDHHGPTGALTVQDAATFPHDLTRYSLRGHRRTSKGTPFACADCHPKGLTQFDQTTCADCHTAINAAFMAQHIGSFGRNCLLCHNGRGGGDFDHNKLAFKLTGKHVGVPCDKCHAAGSLQSTQQGPRDCVACHAKDDKHQGTFGTQCGQCHTANGWPGATFDHTIFPVNHGSREQVPTCQTCHTNGVNTYTCFGCHAHTPANIVARHEGRALSDLTNCVRCHAGGAREGGD